MIALSGDVNRDAEPALFDAWEQARAGDGRVLLDFTDVTFINSTGIAVIVALLARARSEGRPLGVFGLSDHYRHVFEITRLVDFMEIYPNEESARLATAQPRG
jgi:anti-anti-sigma factor